MSSIAARRANKRVCQLQPNGMFSRGTYAYPGANAGEGRGEGKWEENADPKDFPRRLRVGSERRHEDGEGKRRNEPNAIERHGNFLRRHRLPLLWCSRTPAVSRRRKRERSGRCRRSAPVP